MHFGIKQEIPSDSQQGGHRGGRRWQHVAHEQEKGDKAGEDVDPILHQQVHQGMLEWPRQQGNQHAVAVLFPEERRPAVETAQHGDQTVRVMVAVQRAQIDQHGGG
jgi:hypothetical protein